MLETLLSSLHKDLNSDQSLAIEVLAGTDNVFVTGGAGTGKSYLMRKFLHRLDPSTFPVLASTGAAAVLVGGRTFHSFFGLGIMEGGLAATLERVRSNRRVARRLKKLRGVVIDEVSMIPGEALDAAELICQITRDDPRPWGGIKVIAVGDFAQLPPVSRNSRVRDWAFKSASWERSQFRPVVLKEMMRTRDESFSKLLNEVREGHVSDELRNLLEWRSFIPTSDFEDDFEGTVMFSRREDVQRVNLSKLATLKGQSQTYETEFVGEERYVTSLRANAPVPPVIELKEGALIMLRQNDPKGRWVNGSLGHIKSLSKHELEIRLLGGNHIELEKSRFTMLDAEGNEVASAKNFPVNLAYAVTIHKSQGATLDKVVVNLANLWEPGQAYVALSRVRSSEDLRVAAWQESSIIADPQVKKFHSELLIEAESKRLPQ